MYMQALEFPSKVNNFCFSERRISIGPLDVETKMVFFLLADSLDSIDYVTGLCSSAEKDNQS